ncbi:YARHG domain-containing protein [uncultured Draconibacterium sp.]|uniref:YARHG domain-containing protein n=1 Tax=uncultured Draconibacterium sp. TaxID=1573823 RepID=UPI002AA710D4|nr:YARHG domain-containing protein [uncultured Draconibacterium sp.]
MKHVLTILLSIISTLNLLGQNIGALEISDDDVKPWLPKLELEYEGFYKFGESESESDLKLFFVDTVIVGQVMQGYWEEGTGIWKWTYKTLTNIEIDKKGNFKSDQHTGQFVTYTDSTGTYKGLKINNPWTEWLEDGRYEIGIRLKVLARLYQGDFPQVSTRHLTEDELSELDLETLQIMRNEVFARYGYSFKEGGKLEQYFNKQNWYRPQHADVTDFLTQVELDNIELIKKIESKK